MAAVSIGILGGSGLYQLAGLEQTEEIEVSTPFGSPSAPFVVGSLGGKRVAFLPRHGRGHIFSPSGINYRANIVGFKQLGVERILSVSAVGSLKEDVAPLDIVVPDQFIDRTRHRADTFFDEGVVAHVSFSDPVCPGLAGTLTRAAASVSAQTHAGGAYLCMEGPQFSTRAESHMYRSWGATVIGMTNLTEAKLAREAEICYATLALVTDYDCWREGESVQIEAVLDNLRRNTATAIDILRRAVTDLPPGRTGCSCAEALANAILTPADRIPAPVRKRLRLLIGHRAG